MSDTRPWTQLPPSVDPAACVATQASPPEPFAPAGDSAETSWALVQRDVEG